jgi:putative glutathione S-transferase
VNNGVYRCGFASSQEAYDEACRELFDRLDALEQILERSPFLCGERITGADWCLFTTLFRFDAIYGIHFKCSVRRIVDYPNLWRYARELYAQPGAAETCDIEHCKTHYYVSHTSINPRQTIPIGPMLDWSI